jgi:hypothetical protein
MKDTVAETVQPNYIIVDAGYKVCDDLVVSDTCAIKRGADVYCTAHMHALLIQYAKGQS